VIIGAGARVLGNVSVGTGARISANTVVTRDVPARTDVDASEQFMI
jgi:serine O-acetyltransferase